MKKGRRNDQKKREVRRFRVRGERRDPPDMRKLGKALLSLAQAEEERRAQEQHQRHSQTADDGDETRRQQGKTDNA